MHVVAQLLASLQRVQAEADQPLASLSPQHGQAVLGTFGACAAVVSPPLLAAVIWVMLLVMAAGDPFRA